MAQYLSCLTDSEWPCVRVPIAPTIFSFPVTFRGSDCWFTARAASTKMCVSRWRHRTSEFGEEFNEAGGKCQRSVLRLNTPVASRIARGPRVESRSGHDFFLPFNIYK